MPDRTRPMDFEVYEVTERHRSRIAGGDSEQRFLPLYSASVVETDTDQSAYFTLRREPRLPSSTQKRRGPRSSYIGTEVFLSLVDPKDAPFAGDLRQLTIQTLCTNRDLVLLMPVGVGRHRFHARHRCPGQERPRASSGPSRPLAPLADGAVSWRAINHLSLNYYSLVNSTSEQGAAALRDSLELYVPAGQRGVEEASRRRAVGECPAGGSAAARAWTAGVWSRTRRSRSASTRWRSRVRARSCSARFCIASSHVTCRSTRSPKPSCARRAGAKSTDGCHSGARDRRCRSSSPNWRQRRISTTSIRRCAGWSACTPTSRAGARRLRPVDEPVRLGQDPDLSFAPAPIASFDAGTDGEPAAPAGAGCLVCSVRTVRCRFTSPSTRASGCAMPATRRSAGFSTSSITGCSRSSIERGRRHSRTSAAIARSEDRVRRHTSARSSGCLPSPFRQRDSIPDVAKLFHVGGADAARAQCRRTGGDSAAVLPGAGGRSSSSSHTGCILGSRRAHVSRRGRAQRSALGAVLGARVWDRQHKFRLHLGPLTLDQYESFLPGGNAVADTGGLGRVLYFCFELDWDLRLLLKRDEVPPLTLGRRRRLGLDDVAGHPPSRPRCRRSVPACGEIRFFRVGASGT